jgi:hypothetical protein
VRATAKLSTPEGRASGAELAYDSREDGLLKVTIEYCGR